MHSSFFSIQREMLILLFSLLKLKKEVKFTFYFNTLCPLNSYFDHILENRFERNNLLFYVSLMTLITFHGFIKIIIVTCEDN